MIETTNLMKASFEAGRELLRSPQNNGARSAAPSIPPCLVPIRSLGANHRGRIATHLLSLGPHDRYLRFGYIAHDEQIQCYVDGLNFDRDEIFGIYNRKLEIIAMAHLAYAPNASCESCAEFGVSVLLSARGRGYGARLFDRAAMTAANDGIRLMFIHALSENEAMLKIARLAGAHIEREGSESEAYLKLPTSTLESRIAEMFDETVALTDYRIKVQAKQFWRFLADVQAIRRGTKDAQKRSPS
jgi:GNAT superfamily N-acetyltransferase